MLDTVETEPSQRRACALGGHRPGACAVVGHVRLGCSVAVEVEHRVVGHAVDIQIEQDVVESVVVDVETDRVEHAVTVEIRIRTGRPHGGGPVRVTQAEVHT